MVPQQAQNICTPSNILETYQKYAESSRKILKISFFLGVVADNTPEISGIGFILRSGAVNIR